MVPGVEHGQDSAIAVSRLTAEADELLRDIVYDRFQPVFAAQDLTRKDLNSHDAVALADSAMENVLADIQSELEENPDYFTADTPEEPFLMAWYHGIGDWMQKAKNRGRDTAHTVLRGTPLPTPKPSYAVETGSISPAQAVVAGATVLTGAAAGLYLVSDELEDDVADGEITVEEDAVKPVDVENLPPDAALDFNKETYREGDVLQVDASDSYDPDGEITRFIWQYTEPGSHDAQVVQGEESLNISLDKQGLLEIMLTVQDDGGAGGAVATDTAEKVLTVYKRSPSSDGSTRQIEDPQYNPETFSVKHRFLSGYATANESMREDVSQIPLKQAQDQHMPRATDIQLQLQFIRDRGEAIADPGMLLWAAAELEYYDQVNETRDTVEKWVSGSDFQFNETEEAWETPVFTVPCDPVHQCYWKETDFDVYMEGDGSYGRNGENPYLADEEEHIFVKDLIDWEDSFGSDEVTE